MYTTTPNFGTNLFKTEIMKPFLLEELLRKNDELCELQRLSVAIPLSREADIYLFDEPTAYLDVEQRLRQREQ